MLLEDKYSLLLKSIEDIASLPCDYPKIEFVDGKMEIYRCPITKPSYPYCATCVARSILVQVKEL